MDNLDPEEIVSAVNEATRHALLHHKRAANSVALWREDGVVIVRAEEIEVVAAFVARVRDAALQLGGPLTCRNTKLAGPRLKE